MTHLDTTFYVHLSPTGDMFIEEVLPTYMAMLNTLCDKPQPSHD